MSRSLLSFIAACVALLFGAAAFAQSAPPAPAPTEETPRDKKHDSDLVKQLMTSEPSEDDLRWLYSNADEYTPTKLGGTPIRIPSFVRPGGGTRRQWDPRYRRVGGVPEYVLIGAGLALSGVSAAVKPPGGPWRPRLGIDEWGRRHIAIHGYNTGQWARDLSDFLLTINVAFPMLIDSLAVTYWYRRSSDVAEQMALISTEAMAIAGGIQGLTSALVGRERPYGRDCGSKLDPQLDDCRGQRRYLSYFSGHTALSFAAATVSCTLHAHHQVLGGDANDDVTCALELVSAATVGSMRVLGQQHYITDVMSGAAVGTLSGLLVPWLLHYGPLARSAPTKSQHAGVTVALVPMPNGLSLGGSF